MRLAPDGGGRAGALLGTSVALLAVGVGLWMRGGARFAALGGVIQWVGTTVGARGWWWLRRVVGGAVVLAVLVFFIAWRIAVSTSTPCQHLNHPHSTTDISRLSLRYTILEKHHVYSDSSKL